jgi:uncharacterized membrane protein HdeD (DUF308 family)
MFADILSRYWWITLLRGVLWILFGIVTALQPGMSLLALTLVFGAFALVDGMANIASAIVARDTSRSTWILLLSGFAGLAVGVVTILTPRITAFVLLGYMAAWAIVSGAFEIIAGAQLRRETRDEHSLHLAGFVSVAFGVVLLAWPGATVLSVVWAIAFYTIVLGVAHVVMAFEMRGAKRAVNE